MEYVKNLGTFAAMIVSLTLIGNYIDSRYQSSNKALTMYSELKSEINTNKSEIDLLKKSLKNQLAVSCGMAIDFNSKTAKKTCASFITQ